MASKTNFICNHCGEMIVSGGTNPDKVGWCLSTDNVNKVEWSNRLHRRLAGEQCVDWAGCDSSSPAYQFVRG